MREKLEGLATFTVVVAALLVSIAVVRLAFTRVSPTQGIGGVRTESPELVQDSVWNAIVDAGVLVGGASGSLPIKIVEFVDFECPFCRRSHSALADARKELGDSATHIIVHYPLGMHRFAMPAARAAECAQPAGRFAEYVDLLFEKQDSLGLKSWTSFAIEAGIQDTLHFRDCNARTGTIPNVERGLGIGGTIGIQGTPTILINGWRLPEPMHGAEEYVEAIRKILVGEAPFRQQ